MQNRRGPATVTGIAGRLWTTGVSREGEPIARSQETFPFAPPGNPSREGWWERKVRLISHPLTLSAEGVSGFVVPMGSGRLVCGGFHSVPA